MTSPKTGIVLGPWFKTEFYGNAGYGLHSNDIRGATITVDPNDGDASRPRAALIFNARVGYRFDNGLRLQVDVLNLFNAQTNQIEYFYLSRLPGEPIDGVADRHIHAAEPCGSRDPCRRILA